VLKASGVLKANGVLRGVARRKLRMNAGQKQNRPVTSGQVQR